MGRRMAVSVGVHACWHYWGKAKPADDGPAFHRLLYHSLDVAAVGVVYLEQSSSLLDMFCLRLRCSREAFLSWTAFFLSLHDLGKFSDTFQLQRADIVAELQGREANPKSYTERHDTLGFWVWKDLARADVMETIGLTGERQDIATWIRAVCGHHGMPPVDQGVADYHFRPEDKRATAEFVDLMATLLLTDEAKRIPEAADEDFEEAGQALSWWFAGLTVLADWLGSNTKFFVYRTDPQDLGEYWQHALASAREALEASGVRPVPVAPGKTMQDFFPHIQQPSPLQTWAQDVELANRPQIHLLEDVTGAGKTEAALILAYRLMAQGAAQGFFIGLPTMATANAMYGRIARVYQKLFDGHASLALGHGFKNLVESFAASVLPPDPEVHDAAQRDDTASARCTAWLADHNKRVLLAPAGVGTVDQALLAVLHSKHQSLRLLGLFNKVLIIDEVHACDAYMEGVLKVLLRFHASMGGSVILLSATLPNRMKTGLLSAYACGRGCRTGAPFLAEAYPLATRWDEDGGMRQEPLASRRNVSRTVQVRYVSDDEQVLVDILAALAEGKCVGWIRNTVGDAIAAYERLAQYVARDKITLFHARFALGDRLRTEERILHYFGDASGPEERTGRLMIATQVAEQSLDVDFDVLVSDLAPIDRILQRAGRAQRHARDSSGSRLRQVDAVDARPAPCLWVLGPTWTETPQSDWYAAQFKAAQYVYDRHDQLWLTAGVLQEGRLAMPDDARRLIETVFSDAAEVPAALQAGALKAEGNAWAEASQAQLNTLNIGGGYMRGEIGDWWADTRTPSRLGEETREVMLARWVNGCLLRWDERAWPYSMVKIAARNLASAELPADAVQRQVYDDLLATLPAQGKYCVLLPLVEQADGSWQGRAWTGAKETGGKPARLLTWVYDDSLGLRIKESDAEISASD